MTIEKTSLPGVLLLTPRIFADSRGSFCEIWNRQQLLDAGLPDSFVQDNFSTSRKNVFRGIHFQIDRPQGKLVRVLQGAVLDIAVDLRRSSPYFGRHVAVELTRENGHALWIPEGFGHGFLALSDEVGFFYKVTDYYSLLGERTIAWDDPDLNISLPIAPNHLILSDRDRAGARLADVEVFS